MCQICPDMNLEEFTIHLSHSTAASSVGQGSAFCGPLATMPGWGSHLICTDSMLVLVGDIQRVRMLLLEIFFCTMDSFPQLRGWFSLSHRPEELLPEDTAWRITEVALWTPLMDTGERKREKKYQGIFNAFQYWLELVCAWLYVTKYWKGWRRGEKLEIFTNVPFPRTFPSCLHGKQRKHSMDGRKAFCDVAIMPKENSTRSKQGCVCPGALIHSPPIQGAWVTHT